MGSVIWVALGGAVGAVGRYGISLLPWKGAFPLLTLATNFLGAVAIGFLSGLFSQRLLGERGKLFWQTGVCGGFTTFSTFSLEAVTLFQIRQVFAGRGLCPPQRGPLRGRGAVGPVPGPGGGPFVKA